MLGHVWRVATGGRHAPDRLRDGSDMVRGRAAAEADIADVKIDAFLRELGAFVTIAGERIERCRKRQPARNAVAWHALTLRTWSRWY